MISAFYKELGDRIRKFRMRSEMKPEILAAHLNLNRASVVNIEKGRHKPAIHTLLEIALLLKVDYHELIPTPYSSSNTAININDLSSVVSDQPISYLTMKSLLESMSPIKRKGKK